MPCLMRSPVQPTSESARARIAKTRMADLPRLDKTAARENGHPPLKRSDGRSANYQSLGAWTGAGLPLVAGAEEAAWAVDFERVQSLKSRQK
jgi:hypothetical protein